MGMNFPTPFYIVDGSKRMIVEIERFIPHLSYFITCRLSSNKTFWYIYLNEAEKRRNEKTEAAGRIFERRFRAIGKLMDILSSKACPCSFNCCSKCARNYGYFRGYDLLRIAFLYKKGGINTIGLFYNEKKGFLTDSGCSLPRHLRSRTCTEFVCRPIQMKFTSLIPNKIYRFFGKTVREFINSLELEKDC
jgi:hypothetical protein